MWPLFALAGFSELDAGDEQWFIAAMVSIPVAVCIASVCVVHKHLERRDV